LLFPPSLPIILYGTFAEVSIDNLFRAGIVPGTNSGSRHCRYSIYHGRKAKVPPSSYLNGKNYGLRSKALHGKYRCPFLSSGGIYGGYFRPPKLPQ